MNTDIVTPVLSSVATPNKTTTSATNRLLLSAVKVSPMLTAPWPKIKFIVKDLGIAAGAVVLLVGYGFSGKSLFAMQLALSVASGSKFLGLYDVVKGDVLHIDCEQGADESMVRYRRLANGLKLNEDQIHGLTYIEHPKFTLDDDDAEQILTEAAMGFTLCIIDSFRALVSGDENDSAIRKPLDLLNRVSSNTGCTFIVIHHSGKSERDDPRKSARGSSAIYDAAGAGLELIANKNKTVTAHQIKTRNVEFSGITLGFQATGAEVKEIGRTEALLLVAVNELPTNGSTTPKIDELIIRALLRADGQQLHTDTLKKTVAKKSADYGAALNKLLESKAVKLIKNKESGKSKNYYQLDEAIAKEAAPGAFRGEEPAVLLGPAPGGTT